MAAAVSARAQSGRTPPAAGREVTFIVVPSLGGWLSSRVLEPSAPPQGYLHIAAPLRRLRREFPEAIVVTLADLFSGGPNPAYETGVMAPAARFAPLLGLAAALPGDRDLMALASASAARPFPTLAADVVLPGPGRAAPYAIVERGGLRLGLLGLAMPSVSSAARLRAEGGEVLDALQEAKRIAGKLRREERVDGVVALVNAARGGQEDQASALVLDVTPRRGVAAFAGSNLGLDLVLAGAMRAAGEEDAPSLYTVPTVAAHRYGLTVARVRIAQDAAGPRITLLSRWVVPPDEAADPASLAHFTPESGRFTSWIEEPTRAVVTNYSRKATFHACAGALAHGAVFAALSDGEEFSLLPALWRYDRFFKRDRGRRIVRADVYRWIPHDDAVLAARVTGRQIALLLEPYVRNGQGWRVPPSLVLFPGGMEASLQRRTSEVKLLRSQDGAELRPHDSYPIWLTQWHAWGAGGLARKALLQAQQLGPVRVPSLREAVFRWLAAPGFTPPPACAKFLGVSPP